MRFSRPARAFHKRGNIETQIEHLADEMRTEAHDILMYWATELHDSEYGGFYGLLSNDLNVDKNAKRSVTAQLRVLWGFSIAARKFSSSTFENIATQQFRYLVDTFYDNEHGGFIAEVERSGARTDDRKKLYAQDMGIYALCEYYSLTGSEEALRIALNLYGLHKRLLNPDHPVTHLPLFNRAWSTPLDLDPAPGLYNCPVHPGLLIHTFEAYCRLHKETQDHELEEEIQRLYQFITKHCFDPQTGLMYLYLDTNLQSLSDEKRMGHDLQFAWFCLESKHLLDHHLNVPHEAIRSINLVNQSIGQNGGLKTICIGQFKSYMVYRWWEHAELMNALWFAYIQTENVQYLAQLNKTWSFVKRHIRHPSIREWNWLRSERGQGYRGYIAGPDKSLYHSIRALINIGFKSQLINN